MKISKTDRSLVILTKNKNKKKSHITNIRTRETVITTDLLCMERKIRKYYELFYAYRFDNLDKMDRLFEEQTPSKLIQGGRNGLNSSNTITNLN